MKFGIHRFYFISKSVNLILCFCFVSFMPLYLWVFVGLELDNSQTRHLSRSVASSTRNCSYLLFNEDSISSDLHFLFLRVASSCRYRFGFKGVQDPWLVLGQDGLKANNHKIRKEISNKFFLHLKFIKFLRGTLSFNGYPRSKACSWWGLTKGNY